MGFYDTAEAVYDLMLGLSFHGYQQACPEQIRDGGAASPVSSSINFRAIMSDAYFWVTITLHAVGDKVLKYQ